jgi:hypothetical protein
MKANDRMLRTSLAVLPDQIANAIAELRLTGPRAAETVDGCAATLRCAYDDAVAACHGLAEADVDLAEYTERLMEAAQQLRWPGQEVRRVIQGCEELLCEVSTSLSSRRGLTCFGNQP